MDRVRRCRSRRPPRVAWAAVAATALVLACAGQRPAAQPVSFEEHLGRGLAAMRQGDFQRAVEELGRAVSLRPDSARAHNYLGMAYLEVKELDRAAASFEQAIALDPTFAAAHNNLGSLHSLRGEHERAAEQFRKAVELAPGLAAAHYNLANALLALGRREEAEGYLVAAIRLDPDLLESGRSLAVPVSAEQLGGAETSFLYAKLYAAAGNVEKAAAYLEKARREGFRDWERIATEQEFESVRSDPRIAAFLPR